MKLRPREVRQRARGRTARTDRRFHAVQGPPATCKEEAELWLKVPGDAAPQGSPATGEISGPHHQARGLAFSWGSAGDTPRRHPPAPPRRGRGQGVDLGLRASPEGTGCASPRAPHPTPPGLAASLEPARSARGSPAPAINGPRLRSGRARPARANVRSPLPSAPPRERSIQQAAARSPRRPPRSPPARLQPRPAGIPGVGGLEDSWPRPWSLDVASKPGPGRGPGKHRGEGSYIQGVLLC